MNTIASEAHLDLLYIAITAWATVALVVATIFMIWWQIKETRRVASVQLAVQLADRFESPQMRSTRESLAKLLIAGNRPSPRDIEPLIDLFESVADLSARGWLDKPMVDRAFSLHIQYWWVALGGDVKATQSKYHDVDVYAAFETLATRYEQEGRIGKGIPPISPDDLLAFLRTEVQ